MKNSFDDAGKYGQWLCSSNKELSKYCLANDKKCNNCFIRFKCMTTDPTDKIVIPVYIDYNPMLVASIHSWRKICKSFDNKTRRYLRGEYKWQRDIIL